jgi:hypothetical protein
LLLGVAVRAGSVIVYNSRLVHRGRRHSGDVPRPILVMTLVEDGFELPEAGLLPVPPAPAPAPAAATQGGSGSSGGALNVGLPPPPRAPPQQTPQGGAPPGGSTDALLPRYGESGAWRLSLADLASGRAWLLDRWVEEEGLEAKTSKYYGGFHEDNNPTRITNEP